MFWADASTRAIYRAWLNGTGATVLVTGLSQPRTYTYIRIIIIWFVFYFKIYHAEGLAWDWINEKLYWTDTGSKKIEVYDPVTKDRKLLLTTDASSSPFKIVLDPING